MDATVIAPTVDFVMSHVKPLTKVGAALVAATVNMQYAPEEEDLPLSRKGLFTLVALGALALSFMLAPDNRAFWLLGAIGVTVVLVLVYYGLRTHYTVEKVFDYSPPFWKFWDREPTKLKRVLTGFVMRPEAKTWLRDNPGLTLKDFLLEAASDESRIWTSGSRTALRVTVFALFLLTCASATTALVLAAEYLPFKP